MSTNQKTDIINKQEVDLYRDTPVRYLGYANEVGEAFRSIIGSKMVAASYTIATLYCFADTIDKTNKEYLREKDISKTIFAATDTLLWQLLASVVIPGFTINRVCAGSNYLLKNYTKIPKTNKMWIVTAIGMSTIPFIIKPIDNMVDKVMDMTFRQVGR